MEQTKKIFDILYDQEDYCVYGSVFCRNSIKAHDAYAYEGKPYTQFDSKGKVMALASGEYLLLNPVQKNTTRKKGNISKFRSFLLESDSLPLEDQKKVFLYAMKYHKLPISYILFSGGKSYHGVVSLQVPISDNNPYLKYNTDFFSFEKSYYSPAEIFSNIHQRLIAKMELIVKEMMDKKVIPYSKPNKLGHYFDTANKDITRLSRFPYGCGFRRKRQIPFIIYKRAEKGDFVRFLMTCPVIKMYTSPDVETTQSFFIYDKEYTRETFLSSISPKLKSKIEFIKSNASDKEMHTLVRGFFLQLFKEFKNITTEQALEIAEDTIFPQLIEAGYEQHKLYKNTTIDWCYKTVRKNI